MIDRNWVRRAYTPSVAELHGWTSHGAPGTEFTHSPAPLSAGSAAASLCVLGSLALGWSDNSPSQSSPRAARRPGQPGEPGTVAHCSPSLPRTRACPRTRSRLASASGLQARAHPLIRGFEEKGDNSKGPEQTSCIARPHREHTLHGSTGEGPSLAHAHCGSWCQAWVSLVISATRHARFRCLTEITHGRSTEPHSFDRGTVSSAFHLVLSSAARSMRRTAGARR